MYGVNTELIEKENLIKAYNLSHTGQKIEQSYFLLKESIANNQIPKVLIIDIFGVFLENTQYDYLGFSKTFNYLKNEEIKKEYLRSTELKLSKLKILDSHNNWKFIDRKNLKEGLFFEDYFQKRKLYNGYFYETNIEIKDFSLERLKDMNLNKLYYIPKKLNNKELEYLFKIQIFCEENDIKLLAIKIPVINYYLDKENYMITNKLIEKIMVEKK